MSARRLAPSLLALLAAACGGGSGPDPAGPAESPVVALTVALPPGPIAAGLDAPLGLTGRRASGAVVDLAGVAAWSASDPSVARVVVEGGVARVLALAPGVTRVAARHLDLEAGVELEVGPAVPLALAITPPGGRVGYGDALELTVTATLSDGVREDVTDRVEWASSDRAVGIMSASEAGRFVSFGEGTTRVTARLGDLEVSADVTVLPPALARIEVEPQGERLRVGEALQLRARGILTDDRRRDLTAEVEWAVSNPAIADIDAGGLLTGLGDGDVTVTARLDGVEARAVVRVTSISCPYPADAASEIALGDVIPPLAWQGAHLETGAEVDFELERVFCEASHSTVIFVLGAGWCPNCPAYFDRVDGLASELAAAGARLVYVEVETGAGTPASNAAAEARFSREGRTAPAVRVGDGDTLPRPGAFGRAVSAFPGAFVVRTRDMRVIADQGQSEYVLDLVAIARDPERAR